MPRGRHNRVGVVKALSTHRLVSVRLQCHTLPQGCHGEATKYIVPAEPPIMQMLCKGKALPVNLIAEIRGELYKEVSFTILTDKFFDHSVTDVFNRIMRDNDLGPESLIFDFRPWINLAAVTLH